MLIAALNPWRVRDHPGSTRDQPLDHLLFIEGKNVEYFNDVDVLQLASLFLTQALGTNHILMNTSVQIGQPLVEGVSDLGMVTMMVAAAGVEEYQWPATQLQIILNHIKGMTLTDARTYLQQQPRVNENSVTISIHTMFGDSDLLPSSVSQIKLISIHPTSVPTISLPALPYARHLAG